MCTDDDDGCHRGIGVALTGVSFGLVEEGTYWEISSRLL